MALSSRSLHDAASLRRMLEQNAQCEHARVVPIDDDIQRLRATVRLRPGVMETFKSMGNSLGHSASGAATLLDLAHKSLARGDFHQVELVGREEDAYNEYAQHGPVLHELLNAMFRDADADGDGVISADELCTLLASHGHVAARYAYRELVRAEEALQFDDFKEVLLQTSIVALDGTDGVEVADTTSLMAKVSEAFFDEADLNSDGVIAPDELEILFQRLGMDPGAARKYFAKYDADESGGIDVFEFKHLLLGQAESDEPLNACYDF